MVLVSTLIFALAACGESGTTYNYSKATCNNEYVSTSLYDEMYKGSSITVYNDKVVWTMADVK